MSKRDVELGREATEAWNARDVEAFAAYCDPSIEVHLLLGVGGTVYHGHEGLVLWFREVEEVWGDSFRIESEASFDLGERTLAFLVLRGRGKRSGVEVAMPLALVTEWHGGLMVYFKAYRQRGDALSELGVSEDELQPIEP
jgi:hypothetical protein